MPEAGATNGAAPVTAGQKRAASARCMRTSMSKTTSRWPPGRSAGGGQRLVRSAALRPGQLLAAVEWTKPPHARSPVAQRSPVSFERRTAAWCGPALRGPRPPPGPSNGTAPSDLPESPDYSFSLSDPILLSCLSALRFDALVAQGQNRRALEVRIEPGGRGFAESRSIAETAARPVASFGGALARITGHGAPVSYCARAETGRFLFFCGRDPSRMRRNRPAA